MHYCICDQICQKGSYTCTVSRHTFLLPFVSYISGPTAHVFNTAESWRVHFHSNLFSSLSDINECSGGIQMATSCLGKQTVDCDSPHDWLMSLAIDLASLCDMWRWKWYQWKSFGVFSEDIAFACHFATPCLPPSSEC